MLTYIDVDLPNGHRWILGAGEICMGYDSLQGMTASDIGEAILRLRPISDIQALYWGREDLFARTVEELYAVHVQEQERQAMRAQRRLHITAQRQALAAPDRYAQTFLKIGRRDGFHCHCCRITIELQIDHVIPVSKGGTNDLANLQLLCETCNRKKRDFVPE